MSNPGACAAQNNFTSQATGLIPRFDEVNITSDEGSITVHGVSALGNGQVISKRGRVRVQTLAAANLHLETSESDLIAINVTSFDTEHAVRGRALEARVPAV